MKQRSFETEHEALWQAFAALLDRAERRPRRDGADLAELPRLYALICQHYALARQRLYSPYLLAHLHELVLRGHNQLYRARKPLLSSLLYFFSTDFPRTLRRHLDVFCLALLLFLGPAAAFGVYCFHDTDLIYSMMGESSVAGIEDMYDPDNRRFGRQQERQAEDDFVMFGYYIFNNIRIGFRTFASGIMFGLGTIYIIVYNGLVLGGIAGHLTRLDYVATFWPFVIGHGALELTAIVISAAAGLLLAKALFAPGRFRRTDALRRAGGESIRLMLGAASMFFIAAFIEAYWSSLTTISISLKVGVGVLLWIATIVYLTFVGRADGH